MPKFDDGIQALEAMLKQLKVRQQRIDAGAKALANRQERRADTRRKILVGAVVLAKIEQGVFEESVLRGWLDGALTRADDRKLFGLVVSGHPESVPPILSEESGVGRMNEDGQKIVDGQGSCLDVEKLRTLSATVRTTGPQWIRAGAQILLALVAFGAIAGADIVKHWSHPSFWNIFPISGFALIIAIALYRLLLRYQFDHGMLRCWWFGRLQWEHDLGSLRRVEERRTRGGNFLVFVWDDRQRNIYLYTEDFANLAPIDDG